MEPLTTFTNAKVFREVEPSNWVWVTPSKSSELAESTPPHSQNCRAQVRGTGPTRGMECPKPVATTPNEGSSATSSPPHRKAPGLNHQHLHQGFRISLMSYKEDNHPKPHQGRGKNRPPLQWWDPPW